MQWILHQIFILQLYLYKGAVHPSKRGPNCLLPVTYLKYIYSTQNQSVAKNPDHLSACWRQLNMITSGRGVSLGCYEEGKHWFNTQAMWAHKEGPLHLPGICCGWHDPALSGTGDATRKGE